MNKEKILELMKDYLLLNSTLNEKEIATIIKLPSTKVKEFLLSLPEDWGFFRDKGDINVAHPILRDNIEKVLDSFW